MLFWIPEEIVPIWLQLVVGLPVIAGSLWISIELLSGELHYRRAKRKEPSDVGNDC